MKGMHLITWFRAKRQFDSMVRVNGTSASIYFAIHLHLIATTFLWFVLVIHLEIRCLSINEMVQNIA